MKQLKDCSDVRNQGPCIHCGGIPFRTMPFWTVYIRMTSQPSKSVVSAITGSRRTRTIWSRSSPASISGSFELSWQEFPVVAGILAQSAELAARIETDTQGSN